MSTLAVALTMPADLAADLQKHAGLLAFVKDAFPTIEDAETANYAAQQRKDCLDVCKVVKAKMDAYTAPAEAIIEQARADFKPAIDNAKAAADHCGAVLLDWDAKEKARVAAERRAAEEAERKIRAEAEAKAAQIRARAEEQAREDARKAQEAAAALAKAQAEGNAKEAAKIAAANAKAQAEAESRAEADRIRAAQIEQEAEARAAAVPQVESAKVAGFSGRKNFKAELAVPTEIEAIRAIVAAIPNRPELIAFLTLDMTALHKQAKALENLFNVPGLRAVNKVVATSR